MEIPKDVDRYIIELKQFKRDNDRIYYFVGADKKGYDGIEFGYQNQLPGTESSVNDMYLVGQFGSRVYIEEMAHFRQWVNVEIDVDVKNRFIKWKMGEKIVSQGYVKELKPGGYFGIYMCFESGTKYDDVKINTYKN